MMANENKDKNLDMANRRKKIRKIYSDDAGMRTYVRQSTSASRSTYNEESLERLLNSVGSNTFREEDMQKMTNFAYATEPNYATIIDYMSNMFLWRYYYLPVQVKEKSSAKYETIYSDMTSIMDGLHIEVMYPIILTNLVKEGIVYLYTDKDTPSKTVVTYILDADYCTPVMMSQYGTGIFMFDADYFNDIGATGEELEEILSYYPKELVEGYRQYTEGNGPQEFIVDGRYGTYIRQNDMNFPNKLSTIKSLIDYDRYRANEVERNEAQLDKIISHKIPSWQDQILFEVEEVEELHKSMSRMLSTNKRTKLMTTFGELEVLPLGENDKVQNEVLERAHRSIFNKAGVNADLFTSSTKEALEFSLKRDESIMWKYIEQITNFYKLAINNLYNFKGYQLEFALLPITHYNASELMKTYRGNAEYGVGKLELIVASGTKQSHIGSKANLEEHLKLDEILKPLKSSHTQSGNDSEESSEADEVQPQNENPDNTQQDEEEDIQKEGE
jgi:hypothetical protein